VRYGAMERIPGELGPILFQPMVRRNYWILYAILKAFLQVFAFITGISRRQR